MLSTKQEVHTGKDSTVVQAKNAYFNFPNQDIEHCKKCQELLNSPLNHISKFEHCKNLNYIDNIESYLAYEYSLFSNTSEQPYIKPKLVLKERMNQLGPTSVDSYDHMDFFIENDFRQYLILGEGGIGKTHFVSYLYKQTIKTAINSNGQIIPFRVNGEFCSNDVDSPKKWFISYFHNKFPNLDIEAIIRNQNRRIYIIIDAINSIQYSDQLDFANKLAQWAIFIKEYCESYSNVSFIITSRDISELNILDFPKQKKIFIQPFDDYQKKKFINDFSPNDKIKKEILHLINYHKNLYFLAIPYFLKKLIETKKNNIDIKNKTDIVLLYTSSLLDSKKNLFEQKARKIERKYGNKEFIDLSFSGISFFQTIFFAAYNCQMMNTTVDVSVLYSKFQNKEMIIDQILSIAVEERLIERNGQTFSFSHHILQEFFSAMYIIINNIAVSESIETLLPFKDNTINLEVISHIFNLVQDKDVLINTLLYNNKIQFAAECVLNNGNTLKRKVVDEILNSLKDPQIDFDTRINLGFYLGKIGDSRFLISKDYIEPQVVDIGIKGIKIAIFPVTNLEFSKFCDDDGYKKMEYWQEAVNAQWHDYESIITNMFEFWDNIRRNFNQNEETFIEFCQSPSVTKEQCAYLAWFLSMNDSKVEEMLRDLYKKDQYSQPLFFLDPNYNNPSQPVVGVSYYEVQAYCNWLSKKTGKKYRLLSKKEWETAASAGNKKFAFGNIYNSEICNTSETSIKRILPVGISEKNRTRSGVYDLNGNIFEWTNTIYCDNDNPLKKQLYVKGGSWVQGKERAESTYDGRAKTWCRNLDVGFRMCLDENN